MLSHWILKNASFQENFHSGFDLCSGQSLHIHMYLKLKQLYWLNTQSTWQDACLIKCLVFYLLQFSKYFTLKLQMDLHGHIGTLNVSIPSLSVQGVPGEAGASGPTGPRVSSFFMFDIKFMKVVTIVSKLDRTLVSFL